MDDEKRIGRQEPTTGVILPYKELHGEEAISVYKETGRKKEL